MIFNNLPVYILLLVIATIEISWGDNVTSSVKLLADSFYKILAKNDNLIFSPLGAHAILSLVYAGAGGKTASSLRNTLKLPYRRKLADEYEAILDNLYSVKNITVNFANKIYVQNNYKLQRNFKEIAKTYFDADVETINFKNNNAAAKKINNWAKKKTKNKVNTLVDGDDFDDRTEAILLNAIYFKANWSYSVNEGKTSREKFFISRTKYILRPMMHINGRFGYTENARLGAKILKMNYGNEMFAMYIILPDYRLGLKMLEKKLAHIDVNHLVKGMKKTVKVVIPKFKLESTLELNDPLEKIGLGEIFSKNADFSGMIEHGKKLKIQKVVQKAVIEVDERGLQLDVNFRRGIVTRHTFIADHPFMFLITAELKGQVSNTTILFVGRVVKPHY